MRKRVNTKRHFAGEQGGKWKAGPTEGGPRCQAPGIDSARWALCPVETVNYFILYYIYYSYIMINYYIILLYIILFIYIYIIILLF